MRRIAVLTSGGDAPGMNAAIRAVVRTALAEGIDVIAIRRGYAGLLAGEIHVVDRREVGGIIQRGGTILGTARSAEFATKEGQLLALANLQKFGVEGLVVIGGDGSLHGALELHRLGFPVVGVPATIDNDLSGTEMAIGVDTALNTALEAIDRIKDTASAHNRAFVVEVMGRNSGYLALMAGLAAGAEIVLIPEVDTSLETVLQELQAAYQAGKPHFIVVVAEGARFKGPEVAEYIARAKVDEGFESRLTVLGHVQRGGSPSAFDRILSTRLGAGAVQALRDGLTGQMVGLQAGRIRTVPLEEVLDHRRQLDMEVFRLANILAR
ncbi:MAG: 6-phosphofructokinase [Chloroflexi bacterium]|nr:6-phosphofructokinase [Chloroflexota bacterium]MDA8189373.1 6-phosphofructokinase [Dehalococcoidales bacterium]